MTPGREVLLTLAETCTALGDSLDALWEGLCRGRSAVGAIRRFDAGRLPHGVGACCVGLGAEARAGKNRTQALMRRVLRRMGPVPRDAFLIWTGVKGDAEYVEARADGGDMSCAGAWLPSHYCRWLAAEWGLNPEAGMELNAACAASTVGIALGAQMIASGERDCVLVCAADIVSRFTHVGFSVLKALSPEVCRPFDVARDGLVLGDGAVAVLLASKERARELGRGDATRVAGWGIANDANHITGPARDGCGLVEAVESALAQAGVAPCEVEAFCAHGTGTPYNDGMELTALERVFGERRFPLFSVKGAIGHTLGAAGAIEAAICARALAGGRVPPTVGLREPEERAAGRAGCVEQVFAGGNILTTNSGFGGVNAALLLKAGR